MASTSMRQLAAARVITVVRRARNIPLSQLEQAALSAPVAVCAAQRLASTDVSTLTSAAITDSAGRGHARWWKLLAGIAGVAGATASTVACEESTGSEDGEEMDSDGSETDGSKRSFKDRTINSYENRIRYFSEPNKVFRYFASVEVDGHVYMTPADFVRAVTPGERQPSDVGLDLFKKMPKTYGVVHRRCAKQRLFLHDAQGVLQDGEKTGLISYDEFIFLLTALTASPRQFELAFKMFDLDGNGVVDIDEFSQVQRAVLSKTPTGKRLPGSSTYTITTEQVKRSQMLQRFFGAAGTGKVEFKEFYRFLEEVQEDILHLDFIRHNRNTTDPNQIHELHLGEMLLKYTRFSEAESAEYLDRLSEHYKNAEGGIPFEQVRCFFKCLRMVDDIEMALSLFLSGGASVAPDDFKRAAKSVTGFELDDRIVEFVFRFFDTDGDGQLSHHEFVRVMKDARSRGLNKAKELPTRRLAMGFDALTKCVKEQIQIAARKAKGAQ